MLLLVTGDLARRLPITLSLLVLGFAALYWAARGLEALAGEATRTRRTVLLVAAAMRLILLPLEPTLSDDIYRYVWEGRVLLSGQNPYHLAPNAPELEPLRDEIWERTAHREIPTVYPPFSQLVFALCSFSPFPVTMLKGVLSVVDVLGCWLLLALAERHRLPLARTAWYAWNPLVALEVAGMGHLEPLGVTACIACVWLLVRGRSGGAGFAAALGALAKLAPLAAFPMWARRSTSPARFLVVAGLLTATGLAVVLMPWQGVPVGLLRYGVSWEFNGPIFEPLWRGLEAAGVAGAAAVVVDWLKDFSGHHELWNRVYPYLYPQLLAKLLLGVAMLAVVARSLRDDDPLRSTRRLFGGLLLLSSTVYPWYALWVLPWASLTASRAWIVLTAMLPLSYLPQHGEVRMLGPYLSIWLPFAGMVAWERLRPAAIRAEDGKP